MKNFEFKSQICTSIEGSKRLLKLGLKKETADCHWFYHDEHWKVKIGFDLMSCENLYPKYYIPAWSFSRLLELLYYGASASIRNLMKLGYNEINYDAIINCIGGLVKLNHFNKDYLNDEIE